MNIIKILMYTFKVLLNECIEANGIGSLETIEEQKEIYKRYKLSMV